jgi:hypothetical protein
MHTLDCWITTTVRRTDGRSSPERNLYHDAVKMVNTSIDVVRTSRLTVDVMRYLPCSYHYSTAISYSKFYPVRLKPAKRVRSSRSYSIVHSPPGTSSHHALGACTGRTPATGHIGRKLCTTVNEIKGLSGQQHH